MRLRPGVLADLERHGIVPAPGESASALRERLNDRYLEDVRALKQRQKAGVIALRDYAAAVEELKRRYPLLGLPPAVWTE